MMNKIGRGSVRLLELLLGNLKKVEWLCTKMWRATRDNRGLRRGARCLSQAVNRDLNRNRVPNPGEAEEKCPNLPLISLSLL